MRSPQLQGPVPEAFERLVEEALQRYLRQNSRPPLPSSEASGLARRLWELIGERGLPAPLAEGDRGSPGELPEAETTSGIARLLSGVPPAFEGDLAVPARQFVKACFNPEFLDCRNTFREPSPDGVCRRQELGRARKRLSGSHCVDCPYWTELSPTEHHAFLGREWQAAHRTEFEAHADIFLPEDFRQLRVLLYNLARSS